MVGRCVNSIVSEIKSVVVKSAVLWSVVLQSAVLRSAVVWSAVLKSAVVKSAVVWSTVLKSAVLRSAVAVVLTAAIMTGCSKVTPEEAAALAAKGYYTHLVAGEYEQFLEGRDGSDSLPAAYREQLLAACKQFMAQQKRDHDGVREVRVNATATDTLQHYVSVFLLMCYGDSLDEEIVVPMVERQGKWKMK